MSRDETIPGAEALDADDPSERPGVAGRLIALVQKHVNDLYHDASGSCYVRFPVGGHVETHPLGARTVRRWLRRLLYVSDGSEAKAETLSSVILLLEAHAQYDGEQHETHVRVAGQDGCVYLDLCDEEWRVVEVSASGWRIIAAADSPVRFRRAAGMLALPSPAAGSLKPLKDFVRSQKGGPVLIVSWLVGALAPRGPYPVLVLHGEQGTAKSTMARMLRSLVDPSSSPLRAEPREVRDLLIAARNGWIVAIDNVSRIQPWLSDSLCRLSTGGGISTRTLYTDDDETILDAVRPVILTGIEQVASRSDLLDRSIAVELEVISEEERRPEAELWAEFERERPALLGGLLDAVSTALSRRSSVKLDLVPRMADHAVWIVAAEPALPWEAGVYLGVYAGARAEAHRTALDAEPLAAPLVAMLEEREEWTGTSTDLLAELARRAGEDATRAKSWPKSGRGVSGRLKYIAPNLRAIGIDYTPPRPSGNDNRRVLELRRGARWGRDRSHRSYRSHDSEMPGSAQDSGSPDANDGSGCERSANDANDCGADASDRGPTNRSHATPGYHEEISPSNGSASDANGCAPTSRPQSAPPLASGRVRELF